MNPANVDFTAALSALTRHEIQFIVVGGVSASLEGAPIVTFDLDVVHERSPENIAKLFGALDELKACYRHRPGIKPDESHLASDGHQLLSTIHGPVDFLGAIGRGLTYERLLPFANAVLVEGVGEVRVLRLDKLIEIKEEVGDEKDRAMLPILRRTLAEKRGA